MKTLFIAVLAIVVIMSAYFYFTHVNPPPIGGDRDKHGCLVAGGYSFDEGVGACVREFEMTPDIKRAAALAVQGTGQSYALTVVSFNSYEQAGDYDIGLERGEERMPVTIYIRSWNVTAPQNVKLYYYNAEKDRDAAGNIQCSSAGLVAVGRTIAPDDPAPIETTLRLLLAGQLTDAERTSGIHTEFPLSELSLEKADLKNGVLTLTFNDPRNSASGGSCRVGILRAEIETTAKQFTGVKRILFLPAEVFQP